MSRVYKNSSLRGETMAKYGSLEYAKECLEGYKKYNSVKDFDIETGIAVIDIKKLSEDVYDYYRDEIGEMAQGSYTIEEMMSCEFEKMDNFTHFLHEMVYFMFNKLLYERLIYDEEQGNLVEK